MDAELIHNVYDTDSRFSINPTSRLITKISEGDVKLVQYDHNSERFAFEIPREVDGHDMSLCTSIVIHYINVGDTEYNDGIYDVEDVQVDPEDENKVIFSWLISQNATMYNGALNFAIRFKCVNDTGATVYVWNTLPFTDMTVGATMDNTDSVISQRADILEQWRRTLFNPEFIDELKEEAIEAVKEHVDNAIINPGDTVDINITGNAATADHATDAHNAEWANSAGVADTAVTASKADEATHAEKADIADLALSLPTYKTDFYNPMRYGKLLNIARFTFPSYGSGVQARLAISSELPYSVSGILDLHVTLEDSGLIHAELCWSSLNDDKFEDMFRIAKESDDSFGLYIKFPYTEPEADVITVTVLSKNSIYNGDFGWMYYPPGLTDDYSFPEPSENVAATSMIDSAFALKRDMSSGIECTAEGTEVALPDSADAPLKGLRVMGKTEQLKTNGYQLFDASKIDSTTAYGITVTNNGDGSFTITGAPTTSFSMTHDYDDYKEVRKLLKVGSLKISNNGVYGYPFAYASLHGTNGKIFEIHTMSSTYESTTITQEMLDDESLRLRIGIYNSTSAATVTTLKPMLYQDGDGTWEPYTGGKPSPNVDYPQLLESIGDDGSVDVNVHGYQLFDASKMNMGAGTDTRTIGGVSITRNGDGSFSFSGATTPTTSGGVVYRLSRDETLKLFKTGYVRISNVPDYSNPYVYLQLTKEGASSSERIQISSSGGTSEKSKEITEEYLNNPEYYAAIGIYIDKNEPVNISNMKPMIYQDGDGTWEPFKPIQTLTIPTPNGLPGIPVASDGNYTDASGQQWICDEVDYNRGVYVQRVRTVEYDGTESWGRATGTTTDGGTQYEHFNRVLADGKFRGKYKCLFRCSHGNVTSYAISTDKNIGNFTSASSNAFQIGYTCVDGTFGSADAWKSYLSEQAASGTPLTILYELAGPIEIPLSDEEITAYKNLYTYKPSTSIHNSENAHMVVDYAADTKGYLDNKLTELEKQFEEKLANVSAQII